MPREGKDYRKDSVGGPIFPPDFRTQYNRDPRRNVDKIKSVVGGAIVGGVAGLIKDFSDGTAVSNGHQIGINLQGIGWVGIGMFAGVAAVLLARLLSPRR